MTWNWNNIASTPNWLMAWYLRRRGWVCFYLDEQYRECHGVCWMQCYADSEKAASRP